MKKTSDLNLPAGTFAAANIFAFDKDWKLSVPFKDVPVESYKLDKPDVREWVVQRIDATAGANMKAAFDSIKGKVQRATVGFPIFKESAGASLHPDHPDGDGEETEVGTITGIEVGANSIDFPANYAKEGRDILEAAGNGKMSWSPHWAFADTGEKDSVGRRIVRPSVLFSALLTTRPNIAGAAANAATEKSTTDGTEATEKKDAGANGGPGSGRRSNAEMDADKKTSTAFEKERAASDKSAEANLSGDPELHRQAAAAHLDAANAHDEANAHSEKHFGGGGEPVHQIQAKWNRDVAEKHIALSASTKDKADATAAANAKKVELETQLAAANAEKNGLTAALQTKTAELAAANSEIGNLKSEIASASSAKSAVETSLAAANAKTAEHLKAHATLLVDKAINDGKAHLEYRNGLVAEFVADFAGANARLDRATRFMKLQPVTGNLAVRNPMTSGSPKEQFEHLVNLCAANSFAGDPMGFSKAWGVCSVQHKALYEAMNTMPKQ